MKKVEKLTRVESEVLAGILLDTPNARYKEKYLYSGAAKGYIVKAYKTEYLISIYENLDATVVELGCVNAVQQLNNIVKYIDKIHEFLAD